MKTMNLSDEDLQRLMGMCDCVLCDQPISLASRDFNMWLIDFKQRVGEIRYAKH